MKKWKITYAPFDAAPDMTASDIVLYAHSAEQAEELFNRKYSAWTFVSAVETM